MAHDQDLSGLEPNLEEYFQQLSSPDEETRRGAVQALAKSGDVTAIEPLRRLLNDPSVSLRFYVRKAIGAIERRSAGLDVTYTAFQMPKAALEAVLAAQPPEPASRSLSDWRAALENADPKVRLQAVLDTYHHQLPGLLALLLGMLDGEGDPLVRSALVNSIGRFQDPSALPKLYRSLQDLDSRVRANAIDALGRFTDPTVIEQLARLANDPDNRVQANLARVLGRFDPQFLHDRVEAMLGSGMPWMRESAIYVLWAVRDDWCKAELEILANDPGIDPETRERARQLPSGLVRLSRPMTAVDPADLAAGSPGDAAQALDPAAEAPRLNLGPVRTPPSATAPLGLAPPPTPSRARAVPPRMALPVPDQTSTAADEDITSLHGHDLLVLLARLDDKSAEVKLAALQQAATFEDEAVWERVQLLSMEKNDRIREEARRLLKNRYGDGAVQELSVGTLMAQRQTLDLSTAALRVARGEDDDVSVSVEEATAPQSPAQASTKALPSERRKARTTRTGPALSSSSKATAAPPPTLDVPPWARGVVVGVVVLLVLVGLGKVLIGLGGGSESGKEPGPDKNAPKLAQMSQARDLGKFIGVAVQFSGKLVDAKDREGRYVVQSSYGKVAIQFVRPVSKPPGVDSTVDVDGVLLGKTREGYLLLRGRKIQAVAGP